MGGIRTFPPGARHRIGYGRIWEKLQFQRMNYPNWPPESSSPLHPIEPWGRQVFVFRPYAADLSAPIKGPYPCRIPLRKDVPASKSLTPVVKELAAAAAKAAIVAKQKADDQNVSEEERYSASVVVKRTAENAATAAAAEVAMGTLVPASAPVLCIADHGRRPLMFLSKADFDVLREHSLHFLGLLEEYRSKVRPFNVESAYALRRRLLPYPTVGMQRMKKGEHQSYGMKKGVARERKTPPK